MWSDTKGDMLKVAVPVLLEGNVQYVVNLILLMIFGLSMSFVTLQAFSRC